MAPMKRPAAAGSAGPAAKKPTKHDPNASKLNAVRAAVLEAEDFPAEVLNMVAAGLEGSLLTPQDQRHQFQVEVVDMIGEVLASILKHKVEKSEAAAGKISASDTERAAREGGLEAATQAATQKLSAVELATEALSEAATGVGHAKAAVAEAAGEAKSGDAAYSSAAAKKAQLEGVLAGDFAALKAGTAENPKKAVKAVISTGKLFDMEAQLLVSAEAALVKPEAVRGGFDGLVLEQLEDQLKSLIAAFEGQLSAGEAGKAERAAKVEAAELELKAANEKHIAQVAALEAAQAALREAEAEKKAAAKSLQNLGPELEALAADLEQANSDQRVAEEVQGYYTALKEKTSIVEAAPEAEKAAEKAAEEPAAAAEEVAAATS